MLFSAGNKGKSSFYVSRALLSACFVKSYPRVTQIGEHQAQ